VWARTLGPLADSVEWHAAGGVLVAVSSTSGAALAAGPTACHRDKPGADEAAKQERPPSAALVSPTRTDAGSTRGPPRERYACSSKPGQRAPVMLDFAAAPHGLGSGGMLREC
jgi:hypothetical protein